MYYDDDIGKAYLFKIPSEDINDLIINYGTYAHGTIEALGTISKDNLKGRNCEYAIRCDPNKKKGKDFELWNKLLKYDTEYIPDNF